MTIYFYKGLTRNPEIGNIPVWVLRNIWRLGLVRDTKFGIDVSNKILLDAAKYQCHNFYRFWVIKGKRETNMERLKLVLSLPHSVHQKQFNTFCEFDKKNTFFMESKCEKLRTRKTPNTDTFRGVTVYA